MMNTQTKAIVNRRYSRMVERGEDGVYTSSILEMPNVVSEGDTPADALENLEDAFAAVVEVMLQRGAEIPEPIEARSYSGRLQLRLLPSVHRQAAIRAQAEGVSLNRVLADAVASYVGLGRVRLAQQREPAHFRRASSKR